LITPTQLTEPLFVKYFHSQYESVLLMGNFCNFIIIIILNHDLIPIGINISDLIT